ncbi:diguanylate cyclase (GGDEF)-like protein [Deinococcus metalli]|uniref:Diguanylate cyclase (GGDEF)-like protein n=1 Tax=Deinococcus metalli TaxID=1141878 RepID=A0A7W8KJS5_9DEIO|nr:bifunctional diguanylate cyclase/phosphodiesterase [Deinococcus metalli]MBB5379108.1 diguanylate cyclase (GGDEF)-like protein [Deinococcus metalli]
MWVILAAGTTGHVVVLLQGLQLPGYFQPADWVLGGAVLAVMLGLAAAHALGWGRRPVISWLLVANIAYLLARLGVGLYVVGTSERVLIDLASLMGWVLTMPMIEASMRTSALARRMSTGLPPALLLMAAVFAFTPGGAAARPEVWFGLGQLFLISLSVVLVAQMVNTLRAALHRSRQDNQTLTRRASVDALTGLHNRFYLDEHLRERVDAAQPFSVLFLDLDGFKAINDTLGHATGDEVLRLIAARLSALAPAGSGVARVSGDEFVLTVPGEDTLDVSGLAQQVVDDLSAAFEVQGQALRLSVSVGVARFPHDAAEGRDLLLRADRAMYAVKRSGKNGFRLYSGHLLDQDERRQVLERDLRHALERGELFLEFQPICTVPDGRPVCLEALVRWRHPEFGLVRPDVFIPIAEECGLITSLGEWVLEDALRAAGRWRAAGFGEVRLAVNVSPLQLMQPHFAEMVGRELGRSGVPAAALELEVTEGIDLRGRLQVSHSVDGVRALGVGLSLDDFGTGFASLSRLNDLPVGVVKIDRVFVMDLTGDVERTRRRYVRTLIAAMVAVAGTLGLDLVAEGVETPEQARELIALGCTRAQGFLYAPPLPEAELLTALTRMTQSNPV